MVSYIWPGRIYLAMGSYCLYRASRSLRKGRSGVLTSTDFETMASHDVGAIYFTEYLSVLFQLTYLDKLYRDFPVCCHHARPFLSYACAIKIVYVTVITRVSNLAAPSTECLNLSVSSDCPSDNNASSIHWTDAYSAPVHPTSTCHACSAPIR